MALPQFQVTNTTAATALRGEDVLVTISWTQMNAQLANLIVGGKVTVSSSGNIGYISEIPTGGNVFTVKPQYPSGRMDSVSPGILLANEILTLN